LSVDYAKLSIEEEYKMYGNKFHSSEVNSGGVGGGHGDGPQFSVGSPSSNVHSEERIAIIKARKDREREIEAEEREKQVIDKTIPYFSFKRQENKALCAYTIIIYAI
jgi:hypothetical protein